MEQFDCIVVGNDISSLIAALFLARKMRRVLVFHDRSSVAPKKHQVTVKESDEKSVTFVNQPTVPIPGLVAPGLIHQFLQSCGLETDIKSVENVLDMIVYEDGSVHKRLNRSEQFQVYLIRHYPKQRDAILKFFKDGERLYQNYAKQQSNMLKNTEYTISSLMIEWGDYSMGDLLKKYFSDEQLIAEFSVHPLVSGLDPNTVNSYHFFVPFFVGVHSGFYYWHENEGTFMKRLLAKLQIINARMVITNKIKSYIADDTGKIVKIIDDAGGEYAAKHFIVGDAPHLFYPKYFADAVVHLDDILGYLPGLSFKQVTQSLYVTLSIHPSTLELDQMVYLFKAQEATDFQLVRLFQYHLYQPGIVGAKHGAIVLDIVRDVDQVVSSAQVVARLESFFPKLAKAIIATEFGPAIPKTGMLATPDLRKGLSINEQIDMENGEHLMRFENLHLTGPWFRPEAGLYGQLHTGILYGDTIEEKLYYGDEDDDTFYYLTNDEIMMMIRHNYKKMSLGTTERHVNFHVGKNQYFIRAKGKNIAIHRGIYGQPDLEIHTTNDSLANLLLKKTTLEDVLKSGSFRYTGEEHFLYDVVNAFHLDDYQEYDPSSKPKSKIYFLGVKFLFMYVAIWSLMAFLTNYLDTLWIMPFAVVLIAVTMYLKRRIYRATDWFEFALLGMALLFLGISIVVPAFRTARNDDWFLGSIGVLMFVTGMFEKGVVYAFHKFDYQTDYANTSLFKILCNGLTLVWAFVFLGILIFTYVTGVRYVSALYMFVFLGFFLTYYYPVMYVKTNIKK
jgi:hypothetical protein